MTFGPTCNSPFLRHDTQTDSLEFSELATNFEKAQAFRTTALDRIRMLLALDCPAPDQDEYAIQTESHNSIIGHFTPVAHAIVERCPLGESLLRVIRGRHSLKSYEQSSVKL